MACSIKALAHKPWMYITSINKPRGLRLLCLFCYYSENKQPICVTHYTAASFYKTCTFLSFYKCQMARTIRESRHLRFLLVKCTHRLIHHQHQHHIYKSRFSKGSLSIIQPEIYAYKEVQSIRHLKKKIQAHIFLGLRIVQTIKFGISDIMQKKNHSEEHNLFLPLIFQKKKKGEITTNKPYFEAKR